MLIDWNGFKNLKNLVATWRKFGKNKFMKTLEIKDTINN